MHILDDNIEIELFNSYAFQDAVHNRRVFHLYLLASMPYLKMPQDTLHLTLKNWLHNDQNTFPKINSWIRSGKNKTQVFKNCNGQIQLKQGDCSFTM